VWRDSIDAFAGRKGWHLIGQRQEVHRAVAEPHPPGVVAPGERVLEPVLVVTLGVVLAGVRAAALCTVVGGLEHDGGLPDQIVELERLDEIGVPDHRPVGHGEIAE